MVRTEDLYQANGYLAAAHILGSCPTFTWITGGRGTGKTYGCLKHVRYDQPAPFILLRRTQTQVDLMSNPRFSPFRAIDADTGQLTAVRKISKYVTGFYEGELDGADIKAVGPPVGFAMALSTVHNIRGFSAEVDYIIYDEFIPEPHERWITDEYTALLNAYETINRNRELQGRPPVKMVCLSNANQLANPYFIGLQVVRQVDQMVRKGITVWEDPDRELMLINLVRSPISEAKEKTALYRLSSGSSYAEMAIGNNYAGESRSRTGTIGLRELKPLVRIGELNLYRRKGCREVYGCTHASGSPQTYQTTDADIARFRARYGWTWELYLDDRIIWQDYLPEILYRKFMGETY